MSALQDSSHSREQSLDRKPPEVSQHRLVSQQFDVISNNKIKTMTPHQLLTQQNLATSVTIVSAALSVAPRVTLSSTILHQALSPRVGGYVPSTTSIMLSHSTGTIGTAAAAAKMTFQSQQQVAINLSSNASSTASSTHLSSVNQTPASEQALAHQGIYGIGSTIAGRQVVPRMPLTTLVGGVELTPRSITIPKVATISDLRMQTAPASAHGSHLPKGAIAAASILTAPKSGHLAIARPLAPSVVPPVLGGLVIQSSTAQPAKMVMHAGRAMPPSGPRQSLPTVSIVTTSASRIPSISLQPQMPWSSATAIQVPVLPAKPQLEAGGTHVGGGTLSAANILQQSIRPVAHNQQLGTQQTPPLAIRTPSSAQKVLLSSPFTSLAPASVGHSGTAVASVARVSDNASNHSVVSRPTLVPGMPLPVVSMAQGLPGGNSAALPHPVSIAQNVPPKTHKVVLSKAALPVQSISISKMGGTALPTAGMNLTRPKKNIRLQSATTSVVTLPNVASVAFAPVVAKGVVPVVSVQAMTNVGIKPQTNATLPSSITAVPVAKVPPHAFTIQQLPGDGQSAATCRLVSPGGQPLSQQQQQQHPRSAVPPGSQIIPIQQNTVFLTSNCLSSTALPAAALSIPVTSIESRQPNEHGPVLHQVSYAIPDGARYLTPQHLMNLSSTYAGLQPLTFQASNVRPGSVTSQAPALSVSLHGSSNAGTSLSSVVGMANQAGRLNTSVVVAMDTSRLASLTIPSNFAAGDGIRAGESALTSIGMALNQGAILQQQQQPHHQPQPTVIALMQPVPPPSSSASNDSVKQQTMSPRPPILRKRLHDSVASSGAKKNLFSPVASLTNDMAGGLTVSSATELSHLILASASPKSFDVSIENSQSSTDTASSAESTPRSCPPSSTRVKEEPQDCFENGVPVRDPSLKIVPRKKPRKQSLHANEEIPDGFSSEDEDLGRTPMNICLNADFRPIDEEPEQRGMFAPADYVDDEGFRWTRARPKNLAIPKEYAWGSKPRSNHFICFSDVKLKDERRPTVNELANTAGIQQNANGAKINRISDQFVQLIKLETNDFDRMKAIQSEFPTKFSGKQFSGDEEVRSVGEIVLANVQRCQTYIDQLSEVRDLLSRLLRHKRQAYEIIAKHQSKRTVKKKERS